MIFKGEKVEAVRNIRLYNITMEYFDSFNFFFYQDNQLGTVSFNLR